MNGLLFFGLSTAALFAVLSHLIANRWRGEFGHTIEPVDLLPNSASRD
jgi:hypothetical protein